MKKKSKNKLIIFITSFSLCLVFIILMEKNFHQLEMEPSTWQEVINYLWLSVLCSLLCAINITFFSSSEDEKKESNKPPSIQKVWIKIIEKFKIRLKNKHNKKDNFSK